MEGLGLVETVTIGSPVLISVQVLLSGPCGAIPELAIALVAADKAVSALVHEQLGRVLEERALLARAPVGLVVDGRAQVARPRRRCEVVFRLRVGRRLWHRARAVTAAAHLKRGVVPWDQPRVEAVADEK